ncbi:MAG: type II toxin-antitoxin system RelE/ParE family toxin [Thermodesulfobacteriota bacterium]
MGNSKKNILKFPDEVKKEVGDELQLMQYGGMPITAKPFREIGSGVFELVTNFNTDTYRTVVALQIGEKIYVLHAFMKKSKSGIATPKKDIDLIKQRYRDAQEVAKDEQEKKD